MRVYRGDERLWARYQVDDIEGVVHGKSARRAGSPLRWPCHRGVIWGTLLIAWHASLARKSCAKRNGRMRDVNHSLVLKRLGIIHIRPKASHAYRCFPKDQ